MVNTDTIYQLDPDIGRYISTDRYIGRALKKTTDKNIINLSLLLINNNLKLHVINQVHTKHHKIRVMTTLKALRTTKHTSHFQMTLFLLKQDHGKYSRQKDYFRYGIIFLYWFPPQKKHCMSL